MNCSRRTFNKLALSSLPAAAVVAARPARLFAAAGPDSKIAGVQIGVISYSYRQMPEPDVLSILKYMVEDGINYAELETVQEVWAGAPAMPHFHMPPPPPPSGQPGGAPPPGGPGSRPGGGMPPEIAAAFAQYQQSLSKWRLTASPAKYEELQKIYADAGLRIYAFKATLTMKSPDAEFDYVFDSAKAIGANQVTMELPSDAALTQRMGEFAAKHKMMIGYHAHVQATPTAWNQAMAQSEYNGINLDLGHYVAAGNSDGLDFVRRNHARITSMHLKDRKTKANGGANMPWGEGDTPIKEVLQLMKHEGYTFPVTIELEYPIPEGSDSVKECARCLAYAKASLV